jgi:hypothetical protein
MFPFCRLNANFSYNREPYRTKHWPFFVILTLKTLTWWNILEKREPFREAFLYEKAIKTDIYAVRFELFTKSLKFCKTIGTARANAFLRIDLL